MHDSDRDFITQSIDLFCCPKCGGDMAFDNESFNCSSCHQRYQVSDGIASLFWPNEWNHSIDDVLTESSRSMRRLPSPTTMILTM
jgi:uncharacterized protein YbaR (Trm112 family)